MSVELNCSSSYIYPHNCTHMHIHTPTPTHTHTSTHTHTHIHPRTNAHIHPYKHINLKLCDPLAPPLSPPPFLPRLHDLSAHKSLWHQHVVKGLERSTTEANLVWEQQEKLEQSLQVPTHRTSEEGRHSSDHQCHCY